MTALEWLGTVVLVALGVALAAGLALVVLGLIAGYHLDEPERATWLPSAGRATLVVGLLAVLVAGGAVVLILGNLAIAALLAVAP